MNFALGVRDFDVAAHRPHPPGYPVYISLGKIATRDRRRRACDAPPSIDRGESARGAVAAGGTRRDLRLCTSCFTRCRREQSASGGWRPSLDLAAFSATAITASCPLFWYLAVRPMSDLPGLAFALAAQACLMLAWWRQTPGADGDRRLSPALMAASGRMIVIGAFLAALSIGLRSQTVWFTVPLLLLVLLDRIGRGVAGAMIGGGIMFIVGRPAWGIPLLIASGGLNAYLAALGTQAGEDFAGGEMLYANPSPRGGGVRADADVRRTRGIQRRWRSWSSCSGRRGTDAAAMARSTLARRGDRAWRARISCSTCCSRTRRSSATRCRWCRRWRFSRCEASRSRPLRPCRWSRPSCRSPSVVDRESGAGCLQRRSQSRPCASLEAMQAEARAAKPGALAMHQTFVRPLEAEDVGVATAIAVAAAPGVA